MGKQPNASKIAGKYKDFFFSIAKRLEARMEGMGMTVHALEKISGVPRSSIGKFFNEGIPLHMTSLMAISVVLEIDVFVHPANDPVAHRDAIYARIGRETTDIIAKIYDELEENRKKQ